MKYTVLLSQTVPPEARPELTERLTSRFGLTPEQAQKLASRKPGRLMKPTSQARAQALLALYQDLKLPVQLEEVAEEDAAPLVAAPAAVVSVSEESAASPALTVVQEFVATAPKATPVAPASAQPAVAPVPVSVAAAPAVEAPVKPEPSVTPTIERTFIEDPSLVPPAGKPPRRFSLRQRVLLTTLTPLIVAGVASLAGTLVGLPQAQRQVIREGAAALAAGVGTSVDIGKMNALDTQLASLLQQPAVGFIAVNTPEGLQWFKSKNTEADPVLGEQVNNWITTHAGASSFVNRDKPAERYREQLKQLEASGIESGATYAALKAKAEAPENQKTTVTNYEVQQLGVFAVKDANGKVQKVAAPLNDAAYKGQEPLYTVALGVISDKSMQVTRQSILVQIGLTVLATVLAALFAIRTSRRIVEPIEHLVQVADKISLGQLDTPVVAERNDEIGDLARALERMRLSLEAAMERLRKRRNRA